jgi:hypothetical protein
MGLAAGEGTASGRPAQAARRRGNIPYEVRDEGIQDGGLAPSANRVSVYEAAKVLGVTVDAIRKRIQRGTIAHERDDDGRVWVLLGASSTIPDNVQDNHRATSDELVGELREQIRYLREILARSRMPTEVQTLSSLSLPKRTLRSLPSCPRWKPRRPESQRPRLGLRRALRETRRAAKSLGGGGCLTDEP